MFESSLHLQVRIFTQTWTASWCNNQLHMCVFKIFLTSWEDKLAGAAVFTTLDLQSGCWQIPVHP